MQWNIQHAPSLLAWSLPAFCLSLYPVLGNSVSPFLAELLLNLSKNLQEVASHTEQFCSQDTEILFLMGKMFLDNYEYLDNSGLPIWLSGKKNLPAKAGIASNPSLILGSGRSPGEGNKNPLQYSCFLPGKSHGLEEPGGLGHSCKESDTTEHARTTYMNILALTLECLLWSMRS